MGTPIDLQEDPSLGRIGGFRLIRRLATGGTSDVLLARAEGPHGFERTVVLKRLLSEHQADPEFARMFTREASAYARLSHPAIVRLFDFFTSQGQLVMVLEFVDGMSLAKLMTMTIGSGRPLDDRASIFVASRVFDALAAAHAARDPETGDFAAVIHRDVNPSNVLIPWDGHVKLTDFGIAKIVGVEGETKTGMGGGGVKGTYGYMAPEQVRGERVTVRTDVYAASLVLWELLAHKKAIQSEKLPEMEVLRAMAEPQIPSLDALRPDLSPVLREAVARGLEVSPRNRAISAEEMVSVLREHMTAMEDARAALVGTLNAIRGGSLREATQADITQSNPAYSPPPGSHRPKQDSDVTRAMAPGELEGIVSVPEALPTKPVLAGASGALSAVAEPLRMTTPSNGAPAVPPPLSAPPPAPPQAPRPPSRPAMSKATLAGGFFPQPSSPSISSAALESAEPIELSGQHLEPADPSELAATAIVPPKTPAPPAARPTPPMHGQTLALAGAPQPNFAPPTERFAATMPLEQRPMELRPPVSQPPPTPAGPPPTASAMRTQPPTAPREFTPAPPPVSLAPSPFGSPSYPPPSFTPPPKKSGVPMLLVVAASLLALGAVGAAVMYVLSHDAKGTTTASSASARSASPAVAKPSSTTSARPVASVAPTAPASAPPSATSAASLTTAPRPSATALATASAPPATTAAPSSSAASGLDPQHGLIRLPSWSAGRRVWIDGKLAGEGPDAKVAVCGAREVKIGSAGTEKLVNVPCGGEVDLTR